MYTLIVMAAGLGSRFGGNKQVCEVDKDGNFIIDYSVYDAIKAGFNKVVFIIRKEDKSIFDNTILKRLKNHVQVEYAFQELEDIPSDKKYMRNKPWGTTHAVYSAHNLKCGKFLIINADDFYGYSSFKKAYEFLEKNNDSYHYACISYKIKNTIVGNAPVKRGVLKIMENQVKSIVEGKIVIDGDNALVEPLNGDDKFRVSIDAPVSMNMFACTEDLFNILEEDIKAYFRNDDEYILENEILLPTTLNNYVKDLKIRIDNISSDEEWIGMTYREDLDIVIKKINDKKKNGEYPKHLWEEKNHKE